MSLANTTARVLLKHICFKCKIKHWVASYGVASAKDLSDISTCMFCKMANARDSIRDTIENTRKRITKIEEEVKGLKTAGKTTTPGSENVDIKIVRVEQEVALLRSNLEAKISRLGSTNEENEIKKGGDHEFNLAVFVCLPKAATTNLDDETDVYEAGCTRLLAVVNTDNRIIANGVRRRRQLPLHLGSQLGKSGQGALVV